MSLHVPFDAKKLEGWGKRDEAAQVDSSTLDVFFPPITSIFSSLNGMLIAKSYPSSWRYRVYKIR